MEHSVDKIVIDIADYYFYVNSEASFDEIKSAFAGKFRWKNNKLKCDRTIERRIREAKEYNNKRFLRLEEEKKEKENKAAIESIENAINNRIYFIMELANDFNRLGEIVIGYQQCTCSDELSAKRGRCAIVSQLSILMGWDAPKQVEAKISTTKKAVIMLSDGTKVEI